MRSQHKTIEYTAQSDTQTAVREPYVTLLSRKDFPRAENSSPRAYCGWHNASALFRWTRLDTGTRYRSCQGNSISTFYNGTGAGYCGEMEDFYDTGRVTKYLRHMRNIRYNVVIRVWKEMFLSLAVDFFNVEWNCSYIWIFRRVFNQLSVEPELRERYKTNEIASLRGIMLSLIPVTVNTKFLNKLNNSFRPAGNLRAVLSTYIVARSLLSCLARVIFHVRCIPRTRTWRRATESG